MRKHALVDIRIFSVLTTCGSIFLLWSEPFPSSLDSRREICNSAWRRCASKLTLKVTRWGWGTHQEYTSKIIKNNGFINSFDWWGENGKLVQVKETFCLALEASATSNAHHRTFLDLVPDLEWKRGRYLHEWGESTSARTRGGESICVFGVRDRAPTPGIDLERDAPGQRTRRRRRAATASTPAAAARRHAPVWESSQTSSSLHRNYIFMGVILSTSIFILNIYLYNNLGSLIHIRTHHFTLCHPSADNTTKISLTVYATVTPIPSQSRHFHALLEAVEYRMRTSHNVLVIMRPEPTYSETLHKIINVLRRTRKPGVINETLLIYNTFTLLRV